MNTKLESIYTREYTMVSNSKSFKGNYCLCKKEKRQVKRTTHTITTCNGASEFAE